MLTNSEVYLKYFESFFFCYEITLLSKIIDLFEQQQLQV